MTQIEYKIIVGSKYAPMPEEVMNALEFVAGIWFGCWS